MVLHFILVVCVLLSVRVRVCTCVQQRQGYKTLLANVFYFNTRLFSLHKCTISFFPHIMIVYTSSKSTIASTLSIIFSIRSTISFLQTNKCNIYPFCCSGAQHSGEKRSHKHDCTSRVAINTVNDTGTFQTLWAMQPGA